MRLSPRNRRALATGALVFAVAGTLIAASIVSRQFFEGPTRAPPPSHPPVLASALAAPTLYRVAALEGAVEVLHNGQWYVVQAGDLLPLQDVIRTNKGARAWLRRGGTEIEVREDVDVRLEALDAKQRATFDLIRGGGVMANVDDASEEVQINAGEASAVNEGIAHFVVELGPNGAVTVGAAKGKVRFAARGKAVQLTAGRESTAQLGSAPDEPQPIPEELLLSVIWPEPEHAAPSAQVAGKVGPSSRVRVNGVEAPVRPDGRFLSTVPLAVGANKVEVEARDILGRKKAVNKTVRRPPPSPTLQPTDEELWKR